MSPVSRRFGCWALGVTLVWALSFFCQPPGAAWAEPCYWMDANGQWGQGSSWSTGLPPLAGSTVYVANNGLCAISGPQDSGACASLYVGGPVPLDANLSQYGRLNVSDGNLTVGGLTLAYAGSGRGAVCQSGGAINVTGDLCLSNSSPGGGGGGGDANFTLAGGSLSVGGYEYIGWDGAGRLRQTGGTHAVGGWLVLGNRASATGTYDLSEDDPIGKPAVLSASYEFIGFAGSGAFTQNGGTNVVAVTLSVGTGASGAGGSYSLHAGCLQAKSVILGAALTAGSFIQNDGNFTVSDYLTMGPEVNPPAVACATFLLAGGRLSVGKGEYVGLGSGSEANFVQTGGVHRIALFLSIASNVGASGAYDLAGGSLIVGGDLCVGGWEDISGHRGPGGTAAVSVGEGGALVGGKLLIWPQGTVHLAGGALAAAGDPNLPVSIVNDGALHMTAGSYVVDSLIYSDPNSPARATVLDSNASLSVRVIRQNALTVGAGATATLRSGPKTLSVLNMLSLAGSTDAWIGALDITNNALVVQVTGDANVVYQQLANQAWFASNNLVWDRPGLTSSTAKADTRHVTSVAVVLNRDDSSPGSPYFLSVFDATPDANQAVAVNTQSVLVKYTYNGDADLNGIVDERDLDRFSTGYSDQRSATPKGLVGWAWGDFDNNGSIDERDLDLFSTAYSLRGTPLSPSVVPEPATLVLMGLGIAGLLRRRALKAKT